MSLVIDFRPAPENPTGHFEQIDPCTVKWIPDNPVPYSVTSFTIEVFCSEDAQSHT